MIPAVLVVDDETVFLATYDRLLRREGCRTIVPLLFRSTREEPMSRLAGQTARKHSL